MSSKAVADFIADMRADKAPSTPAAQPRRAWRALMGQVLEFGDSGYQIVLQKKADKGRYPYQLRDPEGRVMGEGDNLDTMKRVAEDQARMRDEFAQVDADSFKSLPDFGGTSHTD